MYQHVYVDQHSLALGCFDMECEHRRKTYCYSSSGSVLNMIMWKGKMYQSDLVYSGVWTVAQITVAQ